jgi:hypothetical protein
LHLDGFGLYGLRPIIPGKGDGFSPSDREEKGSGRKNHCEFHVHLNIPEVCRIFNIIEVTIITNIKQR